MEVNMYKTLNEKQRILWSNFVDSVDSGTPYQTLEFFDWWDNSTKDYELYGYFIGIENGKIKLVGYGTKRLNKDGEIVCEFPHGPVAENVKYLVDGLKQIRGIIEDDYKILIHPYFPDSIYESLSFLNLKRTNVKWLSATARVDLTKSLDTIFSEFYLMSRRAVKRARKLNYVVNIEHSKKACDEFINLHNELATSRGFSHIYPNVIYKMAAKPFDFKNRGALFTLRNEKGKMLAAAQVIWTQKNIFLQRAASAKEEKVNAQLMHWEIMQFAKKYNLLTYDLNGIDVANKECSLSKFKLSFVEGRKPYFTLPQLQY